MIKIENLQKKYGEKSVFDNFNLEIKKNKITVILGESGSGKTTLLNVLAFLTEFDGKVSGVEKPLSMVFQTDRLLPNLTVYENLKLVLGDNGIKNALEQVNMLDAMNLYPKSLSAGMKRRVAIIRALLFPSNTLLMDEPFINLDVALKYSFIERIKEEQKTKKKTIIMVTHDVREAVMIADEIVVIKQGKIVYKCEKVEKNTENKIYDVLMNKL